MTALGTKFPRAGGEVKEAAALQERPARLSLWGSHGSLVACFHTALPLAGGRKGGNISGTGLGKGPADPGSFTQPCQVLPILTRSHPLV